VLCVLGDPDLEMWLFGQLEHSLPPVIMWVGMMVTYLILWSWWRGLVASITC